MQMFISKSFANLANSLNCELHCSVLVVNARDLDENLKCDFTVKFFKILFSLVVHFTEAPTLTEADVTFSGVGFGSADLCDVLRKVVLLSTPYGEVEFP